MKNTFRKFSPWVRWGEREALVDSDGNAYSTYPGVYLLAHFARIPSAPADYLSKEIIYVGEGKLLGRRWYDFERSATLGNSGHSGGHSYRREHGQDQWSRLCVAALPTWFGADDHSSEEDWTQSYRLYVERRIIWELTVTRRGKHKLLNKK